MPRPTPIHSGPDFQDLLSSRSIVFAMFYVKGTSSQAMMPIFQSLCEEHQSPPRVAFVKLRKDKLPDLCREHGIETETTLTVTTFVEARKVDSTDGRDSRDLEAMVERHVSRTRSSPPPTPRRHSRSPDRARARSPASRTRSVSPTRLRPRRQPSPQIAFQPANDSIPMNGYVPVEIIRVSYWGPFSFARPVRPVHQGRDGRHRPTEIELSRTERGVEATYMDRSGPLDVERTIVQYPRCDGKR